jgi:hypothetical protein
MSRLRKGLVLALEEMENEMLEPTEEEVVAEDTTETRLDADEALDEVTETESEVDGMSDSIEDTEADIDTLDEIHDTMEDSVEEQGEGLSEDAAEIAEVAIEAIAARLGIKREGRLLPATENFKSVSSRKMATKLAMEEAKNIAGKAWEAILKAIAWIKEKINQFFANLFKNVDRLEAHIKAVRSHIPKDGTKKAETLSKGSLAKALGTGAEANKATAQEKATNVLALLKHGEMISKALKDVASKSNEQLKEEADKLNATNAEIAEKETFLGGLKLKLSEGGLFKRFSFSKDEAPTAAELAALDPKEMFELVNTCFELTKGIRAYKVTEKNNAETLKVIEKKVKEAEKKAGSEEQLGEYNKLLKQLHTDASDIITKTSVNFTSIAFQTVNAILKYVEAGIVNLGGEATGEAEVTAESGKALPAPESK